MKKTSVSGQIVIVFILIILISSMAFTTMTLTRIHSLAEKETHSRLMTYSAILEAHNQNPDKDLVDFPDMEIAFIQMKDDQVFFSPDIKDYINKEDLDKIVKNFDSSKKINHEFHKIKNHNKDTIYYVIQVQDNTASILLTNSNYVKHMLKTVSLQIILVFIVIICLTAMGIGTWSGQFVKRIHQIQKQVLDLSKSGHDEVNIVDDSLDEIGELSRTVEDMRIKIKKNEQTKQEMLQNISHDFKTPIAVIQSYAEAIQDGMADEDSTKIIISQAEILKNKVNRLLEYNSLEYLKKDREFEDVDMKEVVEEVLRAYKFRMDLEIDLDLSEQIYFKGYKENYITVVDNIIDNARRYANNKIKIVLKKDRLRIYNDGEAIDENFIKNSFKPYEKGSKGEFGLGMSIVKKTIDFFGMDLIVKNESIGVSFIITKNKN